MAVVAAATPATGRLTELDELRGDVRRVVRAGPSRGIPSRDLRGSDPDEPATGEGPRPDRGRSSTRCWSNAHQRPLKVFQAVGIKLVRPGAVVHPRPRRRPARGPVRPEPARSRRRQARRRDHLAAQRRGSTARRSATPTPPSGVALYLLVDRVGAHPAITLYAEPADGDYRRVVTVPFGESIHLPAPFDVELDTSQFPR